MIKSGSNVEGVVVVRKDGIPIQTSMEKNLSVEVKLRDIRLFFMNM